MPVDTLKLYENIDDRPIEEVMGVNRVDITVTEVYAKTLRINIVGSNVDYRL
ncbi:MAG: hypothetical protein NZ955_00930 [Candidatus Bathyarchaeota archaeon]|nr:hypothetical protein [Candidatus Bathyarchaeota archaeon]MCX8162113.1 hypothetical protein [Candidatus Bathyarchaeota archaeon]